jgi:DNA (cytosine-5)-methyltransferase 1
VTIVSGMRTIPAPSRSSLGIAPRSATIGSIFSGIGGLELGLEWAGLGPVLWQVEKEAFCRAVLAKHWPSATRFVDVRAVGASILAPVDIMCGGFPCQDVSGAGKGAGLAGERSGLWYQYLRIVGEMRPRVVIVENVESGKRRWLCAVRRGLRELGYHTEALGVSAADVGAPHLRKRIFVVAHADGDAVRERERRGCGSRGAGTPRSFVSRQAVADANGQRGMEPEGREHERRGWTADGSDRGAGLSLAGADSVGSNTREGAPRNECAGRPVAPGGGGELGDTERSGRQGAEYAGRETRGGVPSRTGGQRRQAKCGVGRGAAGVPDWLDGRGLHADHDQAPHEARQDTGRPGFDHLWPAGRGEAQHAWEPPRTVSEKIQNRRARVKALGNAVVPQCAAIVGSFVRQALHGAVS